ncbi:threonine/serine exporter family protein [Microlunatus elymi]|uniref:Threonine/serine exporter family protein n=2 Tax=Microlunatus elymi TaxID=2596828 RepID=A0A516Q549_9ACTN|nr:threonine/serine exporter family protein [Microlunatus elymi]
MLLSNGAGAADVAATMDSILRHLGLRGADVDVTYTALTVAHQVGPDEPMLVRRRNVQQRDVDYEDLTRVDHLVTALLLGRISRDEARSELARVVSSGHARPRWAITVGWGVLALGVGLLLGGGPLVLIIALTAGLGLDRLLHLLSRWRLPVIYQQMAGGLLATLLAVGLARTPLPLSPSLVVSATIVVLLAGLGFIGAAQDALTGYYLTASARILEVMMATAGIIIGVSGGLSVGRIIGVELTLTPGAVGLTNLPPMLVGAALCAVAFGFVAYTPARALWPIGAIAAGGEAIAYLLQSQGFGRPWAAAVAAIGIGVVSYGVAGRVRVPPLVIVVSAITPFLPGLSIYRALSLFTVGDSAGLVDFVTAAGVAIALASGVILGEYIAQPLRREARKLEGRLSGPRLVGPLRLRTLRRRAREAEEPDEVG